jgi:hypothetical protein
MYAPDYLDRVIESGEVATDIAQRLDEPRQAQPPQNVFSEELQNNEEDFNELDWDHSFECPDPF